MARVVITIFVVCFIMALISRAHTWTMDELIKRAGENSGMSYDEPVQDDGTVLVELDIIYSRAQWYEMNRDGGSGRRQKRKAARSSVYRWTNNVIPYIISNLFSSSDMNEIHAAMTEWETYTCLDFKPATSRDRNIIVLQNGGGCSSQLGMQGGRQLVNLAPECRKKGIVLHELGHVIGFLHEQSRPDRDSYVTIDFQNIEQHTEFNFQKFTTATVNDYGVPYDYLSIMHYGGKAWSKNERHTIVTKDPAYQNSIGNRFGLSFRDVKLANLMYSCSAGCTSRSCPGDQFVGKDCECWCAGSGSRPADRCSLTIRYARFRFNRQ